MDVYPVQIQCNVSILLVGAHPDDAELMAGGFISRVIARSTVVYSLIVSGGCENGEISIRKKEALRSAKILGIKVFFGDIKDGCICYNMDIVKLMDSYIDVTEPSAVITNSYNDIYQDHKNMGSITLSVTRKKPGIMLMGETPTSLLHDNLVCFDISETIDRKFKALRVYGSQIINGPVKIEMAKVPAAYRELRLGTQYAEVFNSWRMVLWAKHWQYT